jgi:sugar phosphate isomerase/epimerase
MAERARKLQEVLRTAGADYFEMGVASVMGDGFDEMRAALAEIEMKPEAFNGFIPAQYRLTGEDADHEAALKYCATALLRCSSVGAQVVVLGSGGARRVPEGFLHERAVAQFTAFCTKLGPIAHDANVTIAIEPLNQREDNLVNSVNAGAKIVDDVGHPSIQLLADLYHMAQDGEDVEHVAQAGKRLAHTHTASYSRIPPGTEPDDAAPHAAFFDACRRAGYDSRCSYEGKISDLAQDSAILIPFLRSKMGAST